uniref:TF-B3 domain-containing protein n=1 Tax=Nelumbo nucifera TaxID=4432 RepID=A0A822ZTN7_NELNU|nr:TPA_asm: hypothetical protein HUJ06_003468 [Nelumbo nucifera]
MKKISCNCSDMKVKAEFLKVLQKVDLKRPLMIPPAFLKHLEEESSEVVILEGPSGGLWNIKLNRIYDGMYLEHGWETFLTDHSLSAGDLLVFSYKGHLHFTVTIFDRRACWREDSFTVKPSQESSNTHEVKRRGRPPETLERAKHGENRKALIDINPPSQPSETHQTRGLPKQKQPDQLPSSKGRNLSSWQSDSWNFHFKGVNSLYVCMNDSN